IGVPVNGPVPAVAWPTEPFEQGLLGRFKGQIAVKSAHASLTPTLAAKKVSAAVRFEHSKLTIDQIDGTLAGGRVAGDMSFETGTDGITARSHLSFDDADLTELVRGGPPPVSGRLTLNLAVGGTGRSPVALLGSLKGSGAFKIADGNLLHLDPAAFEAVI